MEVQLVEQGLLLRILLRKNPGPKVIITGIQALIDTIKKLC